MHILTGIRTRDPCVQAVTAMDAPHLPLLTRVSSTELSTRHVHISSVGFDWPLVLSSVPTISCSNHYKSWDIQTECPFE
jgi:hypothetical protein